MRAKVPALSPNDPVRNYLLRFNTDKESISLYLRLGTCVCVCVCLGMMAYMHGSTAHAHFPTSALHVWRFIYYTLLLINAVASKQQATSTSQIFVRYSVIAGQCKPQVYGLRPPQVPLTNPESEPATHRWPPGSQTPSQDVPSQIWAAVGQKQPFFAKTALELVQNGRTKEKGVYISQLA